MKLPPIFPVGITLAAVVVNAIAASVPRVLEQVNLFGRHVDGELIDGLFPRTTSDRVREHLHDLHVEKAGEHFDAMWAHMLASHSHQLAFEMNGNPWHFRQADHHWDEAIHHDTKRTENLEVARTVLTTTRTRAQRHLIEQHPMRCAENANQSANYANAVIIHHVLQGPEGLGPPPDGFGVTRSCHRILRH